MTRASKLGTATLALIFMGALLIALFLHHPRSPAVILPNPNGYDDFVNAVQAIDRSVLEVPADDLEKLRSLAEKNQRALDLVRIGLSRDCVVPMTPWTNSFS